MVLLDETVVVVALDPMARGLDLTASAMHRVVLIYALSLASLVPVGGMATRRFGLLPVFRSGVVLFAVASGCCGLAPASGLAELLILTARAAQGAGAALMLPVATTVITDVYEEQQRGRALATYAGVAQVFFVFGPLVGALLTQFFGWRSVFLINVPLGGAVLWALAEARLRGRAPGEPVRVLQPVLLAVALVVLVSALYQSGIWGFDARTVPALAVGVLLLAVSVRVVLRATRPVLDLRLLRNHTYAAAVAVTFLVQAAQFPVLVHGAVYLRQALQLTVLGAGVSLLPFVCALAVGTFVSGYLLEYFQSVRVPVVWGLAAATLGTAGWAAALPSGAYLWQIPGMIVAGLGMGMPIPALSAEMMSAVRVSERADASVLRQTLRQLGGAFGLAGAGALVLAANDQASNAAGTIKASATLHGFVFASITLATTFTLAATTLPRKRTHTTHTMRRPRNNHNT
ncbi:MFS transporter [Streptomyces sioyaensis]|uniref:MFS transporter n=1 Tax=Streptomyces sioyaensis TaxID=67364 RepID=UPI001F42047F|nr:MFS transporter [Streptomyces sioyaensis]MCF3171754.1 MFS transporter [Streptomyces sioyaensis]